jgi:hypothetical protein
MPSRRKLIEQVIGKSTMWVTLSAGSTSAQASGTIDRKGYLSAHVVGYGRATAADTAAVSFYVYDSSDNSTFAIYDSANATDSFNASSTVTSAANVAEFDVDLAGASRYLRIYATPAEATNTTAIYTCAVVLGDRTSVDEPAT